MSQSPNLCPAVGQLYLSYTKKAQSAYLVSLGTFAGRQSFEAPDPQATLSISLFLSRRRRQPTLQQLNHRVTPQSTILLLESSCGTIREVNKPLFCHPTERPNYAVGVISHGVVLRGSFDIKHTGSEAKYLGPVPQ